MGDHCRGSVLTSWVITVGVLYTLGTDTKVGYSQDTVLTQKVVTVRVFY